MKLSVALVTYNHSSFIEQALGSALRQKVDADWEIVVGDDASSDGTTDILRAYQQRYPGIIRLNLRSSNAGDGGRTNFMTTLNACRGDYVAYMDGDDYWLEDHKLHRQVSQLDSQPGLAACAHPVFRVYADGTQDTFAAPPGRAPFSLEDIARNFTFLHCSSIMYRRSTLPRIPRWFADQSIKLDDWALSVLCAQYGDIGYVDEILGVYRKHELGIWSGQQILQRLCWDLTTREFVYRKLSPPGLEPTRDQAPFLSAITTVERGIAAGRSLSARCSLSLALARFPDRNSLSATYRLMFLIETWAAFSKPLLIKLRRLWRQIH